MHCWISYLATEPSDTGSPATLPRHTSIHTTTYTVLGDTVIPARAPHMAVPWLCHGCAQASPCLRSRSPFLAQPLLPSLHRSCKPCLPHSEGFCQTSFIPQVSSRGWSFQHCPFYTIHIMAGDVVLAGRSQGWIWKICHFVCLARAGGCDGPGVRTVLPLGTE